MAQLLVRNLDDNVVARLKVKAATAKLSLEQYLRNVLEDEATDDTNGRLVRLAKLRSALPTLEDDWADEVSASRSERDASFDLFDSSEKS